MSVHNNDFETFICKKTSMEGIEVSDGRIAQNFLRDWLCSIESGLSVCSHLFVLKYAMYALACLGRFCRMSYTRFESLSRSDPVLLTVSP